MAADVQEVNKKWECMIQEIPILHGLMMKSIYPNVMSAISIVGLMSIVNTIKRTEIFFKSASNTFLYFFIN